jgi:hypothetical protein
MCSMPKNAKTLGLCICQSPEPINLCCVFFTLKMQILGGFVIIKDPIPNFQKGVCQII